MDIFDRANMATVINEEPTPDILRKQKSIYRLFPEFDDRVDQVAHAGGVKLKNQEKGLWIFEVASASQSGKRYTVNLEWADLEDKIKQYGRDRRLWKKDKKSVDLNKLAAALIDDTDMKISCSCPAFLYWGGKYIATKRRSVYKDRELRRPKVRNPKEYGMLCKHLQLVFDVLPMYRSTLASHLKRYYGSELKKVERQVQKDIKGYKKGAEFLAKRQKDQKDEDE